MTDTDITADDLREIRDRIDDISEAAEQLRELGEEHDLPVVERTAKRIDGTVTPLGSHVPPELTDE